MWRAERWRQRDEGGRGLALRWSVVLLGFGVGGGLSWEVVGGKGRLVLGRAVA